MSALAVIRASALVRRLTAAFRPFARHPVSNDRSRRPPMRTPDPDGTVESVGKRSFKSLAGAARPVRATSAAGVPSLGGQQLPCGRNWIPLRIRDTIALDGAWKKTDLRAIANIEGVPHLPIECGYIVEWKSSISPLAPTYAPTVF